MSILTVATVVIGGVALLNLILTMGVIRRLRDHNERLTAAGRHPAFPTQAILPSGERIGDFSTTDISGDRLILAEVTGPVVAGFFTPECPGCKALLPQFVARVRSLSATGWQVLAVVVVEPGEDHAEYTGRLAPIARVVVEAPHGPVQTAFGADAYPSIAVVDERRVVTVSGSDEGVLDALPGIGEVASRQPANVVSEAAPPRR